MSIVFALAILGAVGGVYWLIEHFRGTGSQTAAAPNVKMETPGAKGQGKTSPLQKYVEVTGVRLVPAAKNTTEARFIVVNHSSADIGDLAGTVTIWARTVKSDEEPVGTFTFKVASLGPNESREGTAPLNTKLKVYELPDWQNVTAETQITAP